MVKKAQSIMEYAVLLAVVLAAFVAMNSYLQRAAQANIKLIEEQVNSEPEVRYRIW